MPNCALLDHGREAIPVQDGVVPAISTDRHDRLVGLEDQRGRILASRVASRIFLACLVRFQISHQRSVDGGRLVDADDVTDRSYLRARVRKRYVADPLPDREPTPSSPPIPVPLPLLTPSLRPTPPPPHPLPLQPPPPPPPPPPAAMAPASVNEIGHPACGVSCRSSRRGAARPCGHRDDDALLARLDGDALPNKVGDGREAAS